MIRGLTRDGVPVTMRTKIVEIDPRGASAEVWGIGERARRIAEALFPRFDNGKQITRDQLRTKLAEWAKAQ
jgi:hypothetical protein